MHHNRTSVDGNHNDIVSAFERIGAVVHFIKSPCDLVVMYEGDCCLVEVKRDHLKMEKGASVGDYRFSSDEKKFFLKCIELGAKSYCVVQTKLQAGNLILAMKKGDKVKYCKERVGAWIDDVYREPGEIAQLKKFCR